MPSKKKKYNARFPAGRIKKIMQTDEEIGKVAQAVPVIISRTLELFVESLLKRAMEITSAKNAKTLTPTHMKQCILSESRFDFLKDLVKGIPDVSNTDDEFGTLSGSHSPGTPLSAKAYSGYSCFQFHQSASSDSSSSKSSGATSHSPAIQSVQSSQPKFYKEIPIGSEDCDNKNNENSSPSIFCGTTVIQQSGSHSFNHCPTMSDIKPEGNPSLRSISGQNITQLNELKLTNSIKGSGRSTSGREADLQEVEENGYHKGENLLKVCAVDEDYDT